MAEYICREAILDDLEKEIEAGNVALDEDVWVNKGLRIAIRDIKDIKTADVQPVVDTENMATVSDEFICKKCGIYLKGYIKVVLDEDNDGYIDEQHYDYEPKFCPECGARIGGEK